MLVSNAGATIPGQNVPFWCFNGRDADVADVLWISADSLSFAARQFFKQATWNLKSRASPKPPNELRGFPIAFRKADWQNHTRSSCANSSGYVRFPASLAPTQRKQSWVSYLDRASPGATSSQNRIHCQQIKQDPKLSSNNRFNQV